MTTFLLTVLIFVVVMFVMSVGILLGRHCVRFGCHSSRPVHGPGKEILACPRCEKDFRDRAQKEAKQRDTP